MNVSMVPWNNLYLPKNSTLYIYINNSTLYAAKNDKISILYKLVWALEVQ